jgi:hypothetical protein
MRTSRTLPLALLAALTLAATPARADNGQDKPPPSAEAKGKPSAPTAAPAPRKAISPVRRGLAAGGALVPGFFVHGTGHFILGEGRTGLKLFGAEAAGMGLVIGGLGGAAAFGASRRIIAPLVLATVTGAGLFGISLLADLYGVLAPEGGTGSPPSALPWVETQLGLAYVYDPTFAYRAFLVPGIDLRSGALRLSGSGWFAMDDQNSRMRAEAAYRFFGPGTPDGPRSRDGSFLEVEAAFTHHSYTSNQFSITTGEINLQGRLDLANIGPTLQGSFAELGWGVAFEAYSNRRRPLEENELLTPSFAFGVYLGHEGYPRGEAKLYYQHRHDGYAAGAKTPGLGSGVAGHIGLQSRIYLGPRMGLLADVQAGSAYVGRLSLLFRLGGWQ